MISAFTTSSTVPPVPPPPELTSQWGSVFRDLKSQNIFLTSDGIIKLGDFGIAKVLAGNDISKTFVGTPTHLSPELCAEEPYDKSSGASPPPPPLRRPRLRTRRALPWSCAVRGLHPQHGGLGTARGRCVAVSRGYEWHWGGGGGGGVGRRTASFFMDAQRSLSVREPAPPPGPVVTGPPPAVAGHLLSANPRGGGGVGLVWVNASPERSGPRSAQPSLRDSTGLGAPAVAVSRRAGLLTAPEPRGGTPRGGGGDGWMEVRNFPQLSAIFPQMLLACPLCGRVGALCLCAQPLQSHKRQWFPAPNMIERATGSCCDVGPTLSKRPFLLRRAPLLLRCRPRGIICLQTCT